MRWTIDRKVLRKALEILKVGLASKRLHLEDTYYLVCMETGDAGVFGVCPWVEQKVGIGR